MSPASRLFRGILMYYEEGPSIVRPDPGWTISITEPVHTRNGAKFSTTAVSASGERLTWPEDADRILTLIPERYIPPFIHYQRSEIPTQDVLPF